MRLDQFDKLQILVRELKENLLQLRQTNYRLIQENEELRSKMEQFKSQGTNINFNEILHLYLNYIFMVLPVSLI